MSSMTRGSLPAGVYWRRRLVALVLVGAVVFVLVRLLGGAGGDGPRGDASPAVARQAAAEPSPTAAPADGPAAESASPQEEKSAGNGGSRAPETPTPTPLAEPSGECSDADLVVTPVVPEAVLGQEIPIVLQLRSTLTPACTWPVSADHVTVKITADGDDVWSSLDCPGVIPVREVVVRSEVTTTVGLVWRGKHSDETCSRLTEWVTPGTYQIYAAALGGEPTEAEFELSALAPNGADRGAKPGQSDLEKNKAQTKKQKSQRDKKSKNKSKPKDR